MDNYQSLTYDAYKYLLKRLLDEYTFTSFSKIKFSNENPEKKVLLRHDIDLSLEKALEMAEIENSLGISSTYFLFLRSPFYNIFSKKEEKIINKIISLQHYIGLHFDFSKYENLSVSQMSYMILKESGFIQDFYQVKLDAVSFHRPLSLDFFSKLELSNIPHAYEPIFVKNFKYLSDSRGLWRYGHPVDSDSFINKMNLHILVHPIWWNEKEVKDTDTLLKFKDSFIQQFDNDIYYELKSFWESKKIKK